MRPVSVSCKFIMESQSGGGCKGPLEVILLDPLLKQCLPEQVAQGHLDTAFEDL